MAACQPGRHVRVPVGKVAALSPGAVSPLHRDASANRWRGAVLALFPLASICTAMTAHASVTFHESPRPSGHLPCSSAPGLSVRGPGSRSRMTSSNASPARARTGAMRSPWQTGPSWSRNPAPATAGASTRSSSPGSMRETVGSPSKITPPGNASTSSSGAIGFCPLRVPEATTRSSRSLGPSSR